MILFNHAFGFHDRRALRFNSAQLSSRASISQSQHVNIRFGIRFADHYCFRKEAASTKAGKVDS